MSCVLGQLLVYLCPVTWHCWLQLIAQWHQCLQQPTAQCPRTLFPFKSVQQLTAAAMPMTFRNLTSDWNFRSAGTREERREVIGV